MVESEGIVRYHERTKKKPPRLVQESGGLTGKAFPMTTTLSTPRPVSDPEKLEAAVLQRQLRIAKVASERADATLATAGTEAAQARARYESIQAEIRGTLGNAA